MQLHARISWSRLCLMSCAVAGAAALAACTGDISDSSDGKWTQVESVPQGETDQATPADNPEDQVSTPAPEETSAEAARRANLTNFESYPDPDSEECREYNGCKWAGQFAFVNGKKSESWVRSHNIIAVHERDARRYKLKTLRLTKNGHTIDAKVYDMCSDSDCNGCCTRNARSTGFLIDVEKYTMQRFGYGDGTVSWTCLDCN
jgi:hypothetical protein